MKRMRRGRQKPKDIVIRAEHTGAVRQQHTKHDGRKKNNGRTNRLMVAAQRSMSSVKVQRGFRRQHSKTKTELRPARLRPEPHGASATDCSSPRAF